jgi:hypothetical protein
LITLAEHPETLAGAFYGSKCEILPIVVAIATGRCYLTWL